MILYVCEIRVKKIVYISWPSIGCWFDWVASPDEEVCQLFVEVALRHVVKHSGLVPECRPVDRKFFSWRFFQKILKIILKNKNTNFLKSNI